MITKKLFLLVTLFSGFYFTNCQAQTVKVAAYGKSFSSQNSMSAAALPAFLGAKDSAAVKVTGQVLDVCQAKGCWMDIQLGDNSVMKVRFKDYSFFVPKNIKGRMVVVNGMAYNQAVSVADQRHYAQDAGKPASEINAITKPKQSITFTADGVIIK